MVEVVLVQEVVEWREGLEPSIQNRVDRLIDLLESTGVLLRHPHSSDIKGSRHSIMRELRLNNPPIRVLYCFDPTRNAVLLLAGDKTGDDRFYERSIPLAEKRWEEYLKDTNQQHTKI